MSSSAIITPEASLDMYNQEPVMSDELQHWFMAARQGEEDYIKSHVSEFALKRNHEGYTALMIAAKCDVPEIISILVNKEGGEQTDAGLTALALQIASGHPINLELFQKEGNIPARRHAAPAFIAAMVDNVDALQFVIQNMGDSTSGESLYLLDICIDNNSICCFEYLMTAFTNIPNSYINKLINIVEKKLDVSPKIISILRRYKPSLTSVSRSATTPPRTKKKSGSVPLIGSSLKRSVSATIDPNSQDSSSPDPVLGKLQSPREAPVSASLPSPPQTTSPLTMTDIAPLRDQDDVHNISRGSIQRHTAPRLRIDPVADMILSTTPSFPPDSNTYMDTGVVINTEQLEADTLGNDLLRPVANQLSTGLAYEADYEPLPGELPLKEGIDDDNGCRDDHRCCIEFACLLMKCDDLEQNNTHLYEQNSALHSEIVELKQNIIKLKAQIEQQSADNEVLRKSLEDARSAPIFSALQEHVSGHLEMNASTLHSIEEPELKEGSMVGKLQTYILKSRRLEQENRALKQRLEDCTARIHALERENTMKSRLNQLLTEDNKRSREQSRCTSVISRSESVLSPGSTFMDSMAVGLEDSIMDMITSKLTDRTKLEANVLRRKVAELRTDMSQMLEDLMIISSYSMDLLPPSCAGGVYTANLRERATRLEKQANTDSVKVLFKRHADLVIDCLTYLRSVRDESRSYEEDFPESRSKSRSRSKGKSRMGRASSRSLFGTILHKIGLGGED
ncbi:Hypothetical protein GLP15_2234 [Giardia lamblia P15]|uniref:Ankyrin repeat protein n=1 Tax=Giardia intestinalis (strain P15) TaxID=658858 RepID=E1F753_GIAIA|nr:Hypothetical protein GLP15_2234 [Giardia lamblia P15]